MFIQPLFFQRSAMKYAGLFLLLLTPPPTFSEIKNGSASLSIIPTATKRIFKTDDSEFQTLNLINKNKSPVYHLTSTYKTHHSKKIFSKVPTKQLLNNFIKQPLSQKVTEKTIFITSEY